MGALWTTCIRVGLLYVLMHTSAMSQQEAPSIVSGFSWGYFGKLALALIAVLVFFMVCAWLMKQQQRFGRHQVDGLRIITTLSIGTREKLVVVQVGENQVLLGVTPQSINHLSELSMPIGTPDAGGAVTFKSNLDQILRKKAEQA